MNKTTPSGRMRVLLATTSAGKLKQYKELLAFHWPSYRKYLHLYNLKSTKTLRSLPQVDESGESYTANAMKKAFEYGKRSHVVTISDDSGIEVYALDRKPGIHSHRDGWDPGQVFDKMMNKSNRNAVLFTTVAMYDPFENKGIFFDNLLQGTIVRQPDLMVNAPYGYDGVFAPSVKKNTFSVQYLLDHKWETRESMRYPRTIGFLEVIKELKRLVNFSEGDK